MLNGTNTIACTNFYQNSDYLLKFNGIVTSDDDVLCSKIAQNQLNHKTKQQVFLNQNILDAQQSVDSDNSGTLFRMFLGKNGEMLRELPILEN